MTAATQTPPADAIQGPYTPWPRPHRALRSATLGGIGAVGLAILLHCIAPLIAL